MTRIAADRRRRWLVGVVTTLSLALTGCAGFGRAGIT